MKTIKDLKETIKDLPDDMPITMYYNGASYRNDMFFHILKLWHNSKQQDFFVLDWAFKNNSDVCSTMKK